MPDQPTPPTPAPPPSTPTGLLGRLDAWMRLHPGHPRTVPFLVYCLFLGLAMYLVQPEAPALWPLICLAQSAAVLWLLWRYRRLMPELTLSFHWLAAVVGVAVAAMWVAVGLWMVRTFPNQYAADNVDDPFKAMGPTLWYISRGLQVVAISVVVPLLEEPFVRSFVLRAVHRFRPTLLALTQVARDLPVIGDRIGRTTLGQEADRQGHILAEQFEINPVGRLSVFGVVVSTLIFTLYHGQRDWPAAVVCGVAYCLLLAATRKRGLGPLIWAHGITNAVLFGYCAATGDWQFL